MQDDLFRFREFEGIHVRIKRPNPAVEIALLLLRRKSLLAAFLLFLAVLSLSAVWLIEVTFPYLEQFL